MVLVFYVVQGCTGDITDTLAAFLIHAGPQSYYGCGPWHCGVDVAANMTRCGSDGTSVESFWHPDYDRPLGPPLTDAVALPAADGGARHPVLARTFAHGTTVKFDTATNRGEIHWGSFDTMLARKTDDNGSPLAAVVATARAEVAPQRWAQDTFAIGVFQPPFVHSGPDWEAQAAQRYADVAAANFTMLLGDLQPNSTACACVKGTEACCGQTAIAVQMRLCEQYDLKCVPGYRTSAGRSAVQKIDPAAAASPAFWGFDVKDEPNANEFPGLASISERIAQLYPGRLRFINLLPIYATGNYSGQGSNYTAYVTGYVRQLAPDVLCFDHYPFFEIPDMSFGGCESRAGYRANLAVVREAALESGIPFWNFFNVMPFGGHADPTEAQLAWQIFTSLTYGAKGVLFFCYWSPAGQGKMYERGGGVVYPRGSLGNKTTGTGWNNTPGHLSLSSARLYRKGPHYRHATRLNSIVRNWGRPKYLLGATSTGVYRVFPPGEGEGGTCTCTTGASACPQPVQSLAGCVISAVSDVAVSSSRWTPKAGEGLLIGQFKLADGRKALLLHNHNVDSTIWPTIVFAAPHEDLPIVGEQWRRVLEVDAETGEEAPVLDDSPLMPGLQMSFEAGMARFLVLASQA